MTQTPSNADNVRDNQDLTGILIGLPQLPQKGTRYAISLRCGSSTKIGEENCRG
jgi:hypothetical protein